MYDRKKEEVTLMSMFSIVIELSIIFIMLFIGMCIGM